MAHARKSEAQRHIGLSESSSLKCWTFKGASARRRLRIPSGILPATRARAPRYAAPMSLWDALHALWAFFVLIGHFFLWLFNLGR